MKGTYFKVVSVFKNWVRDIRQTHKQSMHKVKLITHQKFKIRTKITPKTQKPSPMRQEKVYQMSQENLTMARVNLKQGTQKLLKQRANIDKVW